MRAMSTDDGSTLVALDPDAAPAHRARGGTGRGDAAQGLRNMPTVQTTDDAAPREVAEATLNLEPLRAPITVMVQETLIAERQVVETLAADLRVELTRLHEWQVRQEAMRADQTALYRQAAEYWQAAGEHAMSLCNGMARLEGITQVLQAAVEAAIASFWRRAMLAASLLALVGLGLIAGLCGVVWLALAQR
jgi:hypothetical protein